MGEGPGFPPSEGGAEKGEVAEKRSALFILGGEEEVFERGKRGL